jgi:hypothetical protein
VITAALPSVVEPHTKEMVGLACTHLGR